MNDNLQFAPLSGTADGERNTRMAAMAISFETVEVNLTHVESGVSVGETLHDLRKTAQYTVLTLAFYHTAKLQSDLVDHLRRIDVNQSHPSDLTEIASHLDRVNDKTRILINRSARVDFFLWKTPLSRLAFNLELLDSLAETFHLSASSEFGDYVSKLVESADTGDEAPEESWRDFVATLHD